MTTTETIKEKTTLTTAERIALESVGDLRKRASRMGIKYVTRNGMQVSTSLARRRELVAAIENRQAEINTAQYEANLKAIAQTQVEAEPASTVVENDDSLADQEITSVEPEIEAVEETQAEVAVEPETEVESAKETQAEAEEMNSETPVKERAVIPDSQQQCIQGQIKFITGELKRYATKLLMEKKHFDPSLMVLSGKVIGMIRSEVASRSENGIISSGSLCKWRSEVFTGVEREIQPMKESLPEIEDAYRLIREAAYAAFSDAAKDKAERQTKAISQRTQEAVTANVEKVLDQAVKVIRECLGYTSAKHWRIVVTALSIVTGRRQAEILSSAVFREHEKEGWLYFKGQLKRHDYDNDDDEIAIPVIGSTAGEVLKAMAWLEMSGRRFTPKDRSREALQKAAKDAHSVSRYINEESKLWYPLIDTISGNWVIQKEILDKETRSTKLQPDDRRVPHLWRQIYLQVIAEYLHDEKKSSILISEIAGHSKKSSMAYRAYDCDVIVVGDYARFLQNL